MDNKITDNIWNAFRNTTDEQAVNIFETLKDGTTYVKIGKKIIY